MFLRYLCGGLLLAMLAAVPARAGDESPFRPARHDGWITPADYYTFACMREYGSLHAIPDFDSSATFGVETMNGTDSATLARLDAAARAYARTLRAPDYAQQEDRGKAPVLMLCQHQARSKRVAVLARAPGAAAEFCDADLPDLPALREQLARRWPDGAVAAKAADEARAWMSGKLRQQSVTDPLRGLKRATLFTVERACDGLPDEKLNWRLALLADAQGRVYARELRALIPDPARFEFRDAPLRFDYFDTPAALQAALASISGRGALLSAQLFEQAIGPLRAACARGECGGALDVQRSDRREAWCYTPDPQLSIAARLAGATAQRTVVWSFDAEGLLEGMEVR